MTNDPTQQYLGQGQARQTFARYRPPAQVWADFKAFWRQDDPARPLPGVGASARLTGLHPRTVRRLMQDAPGHATEKE